MGSPGAPIGFPGPDEFPWEARCIPIGFPWDRHLPVGFPWASHGLPMGFPWASH